MSPRKTVVASVCALVASCASLAIQPPAPPAPPTSEPATPTPPVANPEPAPQPSPQPIPETKPEVKPEPKPVVVDRSVPHEFKVPADADIEAAVYLKDGRRMVGMLVSRDRKETVIRIAGINSPIADELISRVEVLPPVLERYKELRATIKDDDIDRLLLLIDWLAARKQFELALSELDSIDKQQPANAQARKLRTQVTQQIEVEEAAREKRLATGERAKGSPAGAAPPAPGFPVLSAEDVNLLRVYQVDLDNPPKLLMPREVVDELIKRYADKSQIPTTEEGRQGLYRKRPSQILRLAFELKARELYPQVKVLEEPPQLKLFRDNVWRGWVLSSCATTKCHGGEEAGRLWLLNRKSSADATVYTNYMILHKFKLADGTPLLNYEKPAESPLLQMAMKTGVSTSPHVRIDSIERGETFKPVFLSAEDRRFQEAVQWLKAMYVPEGREYPIDYTPPLSSSARTKLPAVDKKNDPGR